MDLGRVFFLSYCFPPLRFPRSIQVERLAHAFPDPVHVICGDHYNEATKDLSYHPGKEKDLASIHRIPMTYAMERINHYKARIFSDWIQLPDPYMPWARKAARFIMKRFDLKPNDILVTFGQPMSVHFAGLTIKQKKNCHWVAHFSDPWVGNPYFTGQSFAKRFVQKAQDRVFQQADLLFFTSDETRDWVTQNYSKETQSKAQVLFHCADPDLFPKNVTPPEDRVIIRSIGSFYGPRTPEPLFQALKIIHESFPEKLKSVQIQIIGPIAREMKESPTLKTLPKGLVEFQDTVDYPTSLQLMKSSHGLILIDARAKKNIFFPSKLVDYLASQRPILGITPPGTSERILKETGHLAVSSEARNQIEVLGQFLDLLRKRPIPDFPEAQRFSSPSVAKEFHSHLQALRA